MTGAGSNPSEGYDVEPSSLLSLVVLLLVVLVLGLGPQNRKQKKDSSRQSGASKMRFR